MDMDDPWGSPWAEDEARIHHDLESKKPDLEVRPATPVRASTLVLEQKSSSPWDGADDDGFGDWAAIPEDDQNTGGLDGTNEYWGVDVERKPQLKENLSAAIPWNDGLADPVKSKLIPSPTLMPKFTKPPREHSPDPWASHFQDDDQTIRTPRADDYGNLEIPLESSNGIFPKGNNEEQLQALRGELLSGSSTVSQELSVDADHFTLRSAEQSAPSSEETKSESAVETPDREIISSRTSLSPSEHSRHENNFTDSPRTSIEEDSKRPQIQRKHSLKVQESVENFDSLAKPAQSSQVVHEGSQEIVDPSMLGDIQDLDHPPSPNDGSESQNEEDDFGDFEESNFFDEPAPVAQPVLERTVSISSKSNQDREANNEVQSLVTSARVFSHVTFDIDASALVSVYPSTTTEPSAEREFIPDRDLDNTLASIEQRKTWYRISRYGTKRKHDSGDDENYVRATWPKSCIREETLKIVARWMEEDRISGRVMLGGLSKGSSVFGWSDSKAAPVPIANAFAERRGKSEPASSAALPEVPREWPKGLVRDRSASKTLSPSKARRRSSVKSIALPENVPVPHIPIAKFGWNEPSTPAVNATKQNIILPTTIGAESQSPPRKPRSSHRSTSSVPSVSAVPGKDCLSEAIPSAPPRQISKIITPSLPKLSATKLEIEADDWGELVSSPVVAVAPVLPKVSSPAAHTTSRSTSAILLTIPDIPSLSPISASPVSQSESQLPNQKIQPIRTSNDIKTPVQQSQINISSTVNTNPIEIETISPVALDAPATSNANTNVDPWASADFSFFDTPVLPSNPLEKTAFTDLQLKTVKFNEPSSANLGKSKWKSKEENEQDEIVQKAINSLPDLSYMLKR